jgi:hypothetical protein
MVVAFIVLAFCSFEKGKISKAAFFIILAAFIKIYALAALILFLLYPKKIQFILYSLLWSLIFIVAPLCLITVDQLLFQYHNWYALTISVHTSEETGINPNIKNPLSVMGLLKSWFGMNLPSVYIQLAGTILMCLPLIKVTCYKNVNFRFLLLSSILIWSMIFNHIAESASYIVAIIGVAIWYSVDKKSTLSKALILATFIFSILSPTFLFPTYLREHIVQPYVLKALPCIVIWFIIQYRLLNTKIIPQSLVV